MLWHSWEDMGVSYVVDCSLDLAGKQHLDGERQNMKSSRRKTARMNTRGDTKEKEGEKEDLNMGKL